MTMYQALPRSYVQTTLWSDVMTSGRGSAETRLSRLLEKPIQITSINVESLSAETIMDSLGGADTHAVAIHLGISGDTRSHMTVVFDAGVASQFMSLFFRHPLHGIEALSQLETSALEEVADIVTTFFFDTVADATDRYLRCSPPRVAVAKTPIILEYINADPLSVEADAFITEARFQGPGCDITGVFFVVPGKELVDAVFKGVRAPHHLPRLAHAAR